MYGIYFQSTPNNNNLIVNNFIANFQYGIYQTSNLTSTYTKVYNNSFYCKKVCFQGALDSMDIRNNIFYVYGVGTSSTKYYCINVTYNSDTLTTLDYNLYYYPGGSKTMCAKFNGFDQASFSSWQGVINSLNDLSSNTGDPLYTSQTTSNLHLSTSSPAIDKGVTIPSVTDDIDYGPRPFGAAYDMGADEFGSVLPVNLISFDAICLDGSVKITWATATETNNNYFILEKSFDAENFIPLVRINGAGNSNKILNYSFNDNEPSSGTQYYRLTQVDYNGQKEIFNISNVNCSLVISDSYKVYYFDGKIYITINSSTIEKFYIQLFDMTGRLVFSDYKQINENTFTCNLPVEQFSKGIYILKLFNNTKKYQQKIFLK